MPWVIMLNHLYVTSFLLPLSSDDILLLKEELFVLKKIKCFLLRLKFNLFPCYRATGARCTYISPALQEVHITLPLKRRTRGYFSTMFGGSMYAAIDPVYMVMLNILLGANYIVWDKAATIRFLKPGKTTLYAVFNVRDEELKEIRSILSSQEKIDRHYHVELRGDDGIVYAECEKVVHIRRKKLTQ